MFLFPFSNTEHISYMIMTKKNKHILNKSQSILRHNVTVSGVI